CSFAHLETLGPGGVGEDAVADLPQSSERVEDLHRGCGARGEAAAAGRVVIHDHFGVGGDFAADHLGHRVRELAERRAHLRRVEDLLDAGLVTLELDHPTPRFNATEMPSAPPPCGERHRPISPSISYNVPST